jgi:hypothetical protein
VTSLSNARWLGLSDDARSSTGWGLLMTGRYRTLCPASGTAPGGCSNMLLSCAADLKTKPSGRGPRIVVDISQAGNADFGLPHVHVPPVRCQTCPSSGALRRLGDRERPCQVGGAERAGPTGQTWPVQCSTTSNHEPFDLLCGPTGPVASDCIKRGRQPLCRMRVPHRHGQARREPRRGRTCGGCGS